MQCRTRGDGQKASGRKQKVAKGAGFGHHDRARHRQSRFGESFDEQGLGWILGRQHDPLFVDEIGKLNVAAMRQWILYSCHDEEALIEQFFRDEFLCER